MGGLWLVDRRLVARYLAPAALLLAVTAVVLVVRASLRSDEPVKTKTTPAATKAPAGTSRLRPPPASKQYYVIRSGDTLGAIASRFATTVDKLLKLNPGVEPTALTPGTHVRVR